MTDFTTRAAVKQAQANARYDILRQIVQLWLPGLGTLYFTIAQIWGLPYAEQVVGTIAALTVFGGVIVGVKRKGYTGG